MQGWLGVGLTVMLVVAILSLNSLGQVRTEASDTNFSPTSELISLNSTSVTKDVTIGEQTIHCGSFKVKVDVTKDVFYESDKLIIKGYAPHGANLEGKLIPLDGVTHGKSVDIPLKGSHYEFLLHQFGSEDTELKYAVIVNAYKETHSGTCILGDYVLLEYKGGRK